MQIIYGILTALLIVSLIGTLLEVSHFKYYKKVYDSLPQKKFYRNKRQIYDHSFDDMFKGKRKEFIWFLDDNSFCLHEGVYLHGEIIFDILSPYSFYWRLKYKKWFKENVDIETVEKY